MNSPESFLDRLLSALQFAIIGRPCELGIVRWESLSWSISAMTAVIEVARTKVTKNQVLHLFCGPTGFEHTGFANDIFHCLGTVIVTGGNRIMANQTIFAPISKGPNKGKVDGVSAHLNHVLRNTFKGRSFQSYSARRGSASHAAGHKKIKNYAVINRGGWKVESLSTAFEYMVGTFEEDQEIGAYIHFYYFLSYILFLSFSSLL
jgi:hypothetical protein